LLRRLHHHKKRLLSPDAWKTRLIFWGGAIGLGLTASLFAMSADYANEGFRAVIDHWPYAAFVICPLGLGLAAWLTHNYLPGTEGSGIPQCIAALDMSEPTNRPKLLSMRIAGGKILLTLLGLLSGASIGREGPTVHVGASLMFSLGRIARFPYHYMDRGLILAGGAAGIAAAFNTPLAGILFAIEEMSRSFEERTSGVLVTAVLLAGITAVTVQGNYTYFGSTSVSVDPHAIWIPTIVCGVLGGALGGIFSGGLVYALGRIKPLARKHPVLLAVGCGLMLAILGAASGQLTFGTGYAEAQQFVSRTDTEAGTYPILKLLATFFSYLSGIPGGIFAPSLATGAGLGASLAHWLTAVPPTAVVILAMCGYFTGVVQTPITAFVIVTEMTDTNGLVLPLMATAFIGYVTSKIFCPEPIYQAMARGFQPAAREG